MGASRLPVPVLVSTSKPVFTPDKWLGYRVARWLVINKYGEKTNKHGKTGTNMENNGILPVQFVRKNRGLLRSKLLVVFLMLFVETWNLLPLRKLVAKVITPLYY